MALQTCSAWWTFLLDHFMTRFSSGQALLHQVLLRLVLLAALSARLVRCALQRGMTRGEDLVSVLKVSESKTTPFSTLGKSDHGYPSTRAAQAARVLKVSESKTTPFSTLGKSDHGYPSTRAAQAAQWISQGAAGSYIAFGHAQP